MGKKRSGLWFVIFLLFVIPVYSEAFAHSMFNSAEEFYGGYRVQVATAPEFPQIGETSQLLVRVTDADFNEVDRFTMGIRFFFNGQQIDAIQPQSHEGGHWDYDYVWKQQGNHIVKIDLYDMKGNPGVLTYTFNMGDLAISFAITIGAMTFASVIGYIYLPKIFKRTKP